MKVSTMTSIPPRSNPFHYDHFRQGTQINDRFIAMFADSCPGELIIVDLETGLRKKLVFPPAGKWKEVETEKKPECEHTRCSTKGLHVQTIG